VSRRLCSASICCTPWDESKHEEINTAYQVIVTRHESATEEGVEEVLRRVSVSENVKVCNESQRLSADMTIDEAIDELLDQLDAHCRHRHR